LGVFVTGGDCSDEPRDSLEEELHAVVNRVDPVPEEVVADARQAFHAVAPEDSALLELLYDSALDERLTSMKADDGVRLLAFGGGGLRVEVRFSGREDDCALSGWTAPIRVATVRVRTGRDARYAELTENGAFVTRQSHSEPMRLELESEVFGRLHKWHTEWFTA
jgi:hypothetical protein